MVLQDQKVPFGSASPRRLSTGVSPADRLASQKGRDIGSEHSLLPHAVAVANGKDAARPRRTEDLMGQVEK